MPSLREVAAELRINVHTVGKAWKELEREGVLVRERGGPYRVGASTEAAEDLLRVDALALLTRGASWACGIGMWCRSSSTSWRPVPGRLPGAHAIVWPR